MISAMTAEPRVSVVIPSFNCASLVTSAIESVYAQTLAGYEIVLVDDGSTDNTKEILQPYLNRPDFHYIYQENRGLPGARNTGIRNARGEYIFILDADDRIAPECLALHLAAVERDRADWAVCDVLRVEGSDERVIESRLPREGALECALENEFKYNAFFFRRETLEKVGLFDEEQRVYEDIDLYARLLRAGAPVTSVHEPVYIYLIRSGSLTKEGKRLRNLGYMERFYRRHYRELANGGNRLAAAKYGELMWRLAGNYREAGGGWARALPCLVQVIWYAPKQIAKKIVRKIGGWIAGACE